jgi:Tat protein secretion system quality control protein TatD with DNase activity
VISDPHPEYRNVFFSFSTAINQRSPRLRANIAAVADDRVLVESDSSSSIGAPERLWDVTGIVAEVKGWTAEEAVAHLERNWRAYAVHLSSGTFSE